MFYDVRFDAIAPKSADSTEQEEVIRLIINVEAQTKFKPGYPLTKRAIYYCSRMISVQHGPIFTKSEYGKIRKVYSIWICTQPSDGFENTLTRYSIKPEQLIGEAQEETENYDLMSVVMICLGKPGTENHKGILKFMEVLLSSTRSGSEKKKILEEEFGVAMGEELEREVLDITSGNHGKGSSTAMNRIVFCLHNCFMRNMNYTHAVWEGRNGCVNLFTCCEMKQCLKNNARTHKKSIKIWGIYENTIDNFPILCYI